MMPADLTRPPEIQRANILDTIEGLFTDEVGIVVLEGADGIGKTTVLRQLVERYPHRTLAVFLSAASRWAYDPTIMLDEYCDQMARIVAPTHQPERDSAADRRFNKLMYAVGRLVRASGEPIYFILDGLEEIPPEDRGTRDELFRNIPFQMKGIRCLVTGTAADLPFTPAARRCLKAFPISTITREEAERYLADLGLPQEEVRAICTETKGVPGWLASVRRLLNQGLPVGEVLAELHQKEPDLFKLEWLSVGDDPTRRLLLALLARDNRPYTVPRISDITDLSKEIIEDSLGHLRFLVWEDASGEVKTIRYVSESFRRAADLSLLEYRQQIDDLILRFLQLDPESDEALATVLKVKRS